MPAVTKNGNLHAAKAAKRDEFYTQLDDIAAEVSNYYDSIMPGQTIPDNWRNPFRGKTVLMNCDDPVWSNFWRYFVRQFDTLHIGKLIATHYELDGTPSYAMVLDRDKDGHANNYGRDDEGMPAGRRIDLGGNGDFRSPECLAFLEEADIVVTNPPFSLWREYVQTIMEHEKQFLILGNVNAITYKELFPRIRDNELWLGPSITSGDREFRVPDSYPLNAAGCRIDEHGQKFIRVKGVRWFTNLDHRRRHDKLDLVLSYTKTPEKYPTYDNYDAIEVGKVAHIPYDYDGVMGVPITFLDKYNPEQFEIINLDTDDPDAWIGHGPSVAGVNKYRRIFIRNRNPEQSFSL